MLTRLALAVSLVLLASPAQASPEDRMLVPPSMYLLPIHVGALDSHVDLQLFYTHFTTFGATVDPVVFGAEGKIALFDRLELGLNVPFVTHVGASFGGALYSDTQFGDMIVPIKLKLLGSSTGMYCFSLFLDTTLPTHSGKIGNKDYRSYANLNGGLAVSLAFLKIIHLGASLGVWGRVSDTSDANLSIFNIDLFLGVKALRWLAPLLGFQIGVPMTPSGISHDPAATILIGVQFFPIQWIHLDLATRVAFNNEGKAYNSLGQASLIFSGGFRF
jgi:hypothetical protein